MSSAKSSKSDKKKDEKKIVVSFTSDSDDDTKSSSSSSSSDSSSEEEVKGKSSVVPAGKSTSVDEAKDSNKTKPLAALSKSSPVTTPTPEQQQPRESDLPASNEQEKPTGKTIKKTKDTTKPASDDSNDNGTVSPSSDKSNKTGSSETQVKTKKKISTKSESSTLNGSAPSSNTTSEVKPIENEKESDDVVVKTVTKIKKKTSKTTEAVENGDAGTSKITSKKALTEEIEASPNSENVKNKEKAVSVSASDESNVKPVKKTTKKSSKTSSTVIDGESDKTTVVEGLNDKVAEKKVSTKSKEIIKDSGSDQIDTTAKLEKDDSTAQEENGKQITINHTKEQEIAVTEKSEEKPKIKKKKEKVVEGVQEVEASATNSDIPTTDVKVVRKKKVKKVVPADGPENISPVAASEPVDFISVPTSTILATAADTNQQTQDAIDKSDLDADREVQSICDAPQFDEKSEVSSPLVCIQNDLTVEEPSAVNDDKPAESAFEPVQINGKETEPIVTLTVVENDEDKLQAATTLQSDSSVIEAELTSETGKQSFAEDGFSDAIVSDKAAEFDEKDVVADKKDTATEDGVGRPRVNEESDFSFRRKSMDDFIKRILAEAREEQQKRTAMPTLENALKALDTDESDQLNEFTTDNDHSTIDKQSMSYEKSRFKKTTPEDLEFNSKKFGPSTDLDLDEDLAQIKGYFSRRNKPDSLNDIGNDDVLTTETSFRSRISRLDIGNDDNANQKFMKDVDDGSSYLSRLRQQQQPSSDRRDTFGEDPYCPRRRDETSDVVRGSILPVRSVIDQQTEVIQQLKTTSRSVDDLENEIRSLRETFLDRQARIDSLRRAIDAESRVYDAEQTAANERIHQQKIPGGHFVREEFMATLIQPRQVTTSSDSLFRSRSGSISSSSAADSGFGSFSASASGTKDPFSFVRASSVKPGQVSGSSSSQRRQLFDTDDSSSLLTPTTASAGYAVTSGMLRRAGSVARERTQTTEEMFDGIGGGGGTSSWTPPARLSTDGSSSYSSPSSWQSYSTSTPPDRTANRYGSSYSSTSYGRYQSDQNDYRPPSLYSSSSNYSNPSERISSRLGLDRSYLRDAASPSSSISERYSSADGGSIDSSRSRRRTQSADGSSIDSSRSRRAQSVFDTSSDNKYSTSYDSSYVSGLSSSGGGAAGGSEFQSRFLDKVRGKKAAGEDIAAGSGQFKSRFLRTNFDSTSKKY